MNVSIRKATLADLDTIQALNERLFLSDSAFVQGLNSQWPYEEGKAYFESIITNKESICLVAKADDQIVGYLAGRLHKPFSAWTHRRSELDNMFVDENYRSGGIGSSLIQAFFAWSKQNSVTHVLVGAFAGNEKAIAFYQKNGFSPFEVVQQAILSD